MSESFYISCAPAGVGVGSNLGMNTVDLAAHSILKERGLTDRVTLSRPWPAFFNAGGGEAAPGQGLDRWPMDFQHSRTAWLEGEGPFSILYWGDFQHGRDYQTQSAKRAVQVATQMGESLSERDALEWSYKYFLVEEALKQDRVKTLGAFGGTLFQNGLMDYADERYAAALKAVYDKATLALPREAYSALKISKFKNSPDANWLGCDPAFLNRPEELLDIEKKEPAVTAEFEGQLGVFFGRSTKSLSKLAVASFIRKLAARTGTRPCWLPWGMHGKNLLADLSKRFRVFMPSMRTLPGDGQVMAGDILSMMSRMKLVVTDTYHFAINAIVLGVPAVLIYEPFPDARRNANMGFRVSLRDKRALLFSSFDLVDLLVPSVGLSNGGYRSEKAEHVADIIEQGLYKKPYRRLAEQGAHNRKKVGDFLAEVAG